MPPAPGFAAVQPQVPAAELVQVKASGHIIGFLPQKVYMAAMDHLLSVDFLGTPGSAPQQAQDQVTYANLWDGVDVTYETVAEGIAKTTYTVAPNADPNQIRLRYNLPVELQADGSLRVSDPGADSLAGIASSTGASISSTAGSGYMHESAPVAWQEVGDQRVSVEVAFQVDNENEVSFQVGQYDPRRPLVIDPTYSWHTFYGVKPVFTGTAITADGSGNVYMVGNVTSPFNYNNFTISPELNYHGGSDIVVIKYDALGQAQWYTFLGGTYQDYGTGVAVFGDSLYVVGYSTASWVGRDMYGAQLNPLNPYTPGYTDAVIISLSSIGGSMKWHTFYGSDNIDTAQGVVVLSDGNLVVIGSSYDTWRGPASQSPLHAFSGQYDFSDIMLLKLNSSGAYLWHTFYGSSNHDYGTAITRGSNDAIYVAGNSNASWNNATTGPLHSHSGGSDITVLVVSTVGVYSWHTFYGSSSSDAATALVVNSNQNMVYVAGHSAASWLGSSSANPLHAHSGGSDIFALALGTSGGYSWHTFYGSNRTEEAYGITLIPTGMGSIVLVGKSQLGWYGPAGQLPEHAYTTGRVGSDGWDLFALHLDYTGAYQWHTFYGSPEHESANAVVYQANAGLVLTGYGEAIWPDYSTVKYYTGQNLLRLNLDSLDGSYSSHKFYGITTSDDATGMTVTSSGEVILIGTSLGSWLGGGNAAPKHPHSGGDSVDIAILKLSSNGDYQWHTFYGAQSGRDYASNAAVDASGNIYVSLTSSTPWLGDGNTAPVNPHSGLENDAGVLKLNASGVYQWHTFLGGTGSQGTSGIAVASSSVYVSGSSSASFLGPGSIAPLNSYKGAGDILVFSLNSSTGAYNWHTFYGIDTVDDSSADLELDASGYLYILGTGGDWSGPSFQLPIHPADGVEDNISLLKLTSSGAYLWHTFYGSGHATALSVRGEAVTAVGYSSASWIGEGGALPLHDHYGSSSWDIFVLQLNRSGSYNWHTFLGDSGSDFPNDVTTGADGMVYVAGDSNRTWNGPNGESAVNPYGGLYDAVLFALRPNGSYLWHTFYGSPEDDQAEGIGIDSLNNLYVGGMSAISWRGDGDTAALHAHSGSGDFFVMRLDNIQHVFIPMIRK
jgi:hypothetical protein